MLDVENLTVAYGGVTIVEGAGFSLGSGEMAALIGPNGVGKSTLLKAIAGLVPAGGRITLEGRALRSSERHDDIAYMPQDIGPSSSLTVLEVVLLGRVRSLGLSVPPTVAGQALAALEGFGLAALQARTLDALSGGQRQLVFLAQALFREPKVLLLDEPTTALDLRHQLIVLDAIRGHCERTGTSALIAMHDLAMAAHHCSRMICLHDRRIDADGAPGEVLTAERLRRVYRVDATVERAAGGRLHVTPLSAS